MMKELYRVRGLLNKGFVGQITYTVCLPFACEALDIELAFEKQHYPSLEAVPRKEITDYCLKEYGMDLSGRDENQVFLEEIKTEIHLMATLNDCFIGCIHRQLTKRHMHYSRDDVTPGCILPDTIQGVLKATVLVFHVLMDDTPYELTVSVREKEADEDELSKT